MINYDMHVHSTYSDGVLTIKEIIDICREKKLSGVAITDHDTVSAFSDKDFLDEKDIDIIPGIELSTSYKGYEIHILGYYIDYTNKELNDVLSRIQNFRLNRLDNIIIKLDELGYKITKDDVLKEVQKDSSVGRPHIARCLVKKGYFKDTKEVFNEILGNGKPACIDRFKLHPSEGIDIIKKAGGIPILAHPYVSKSSSSTLEFKEFITDMVDYGIMGIEVFHSLHSNKEEGTLLNYVIKNNLLITGGSDCHEKLNSKGELIIGTKGIDVERVNKLKSMR